MLRSDICDECLECMKLQDRRSFDTCGTYVEAIKNGKGVQTKVDIFGKHECPLFSGDQIARLLGVKPQNVGSYFEGTKSLDTNMCFKIRAFCFGEKSKNNKFMLTQNGVVELARAIGTSRAKSFMNLFISHIVPFTRDPDNIKRVTTAVSVLQTHVIKGNVRGVMQAFLTGNDMGVVDSLGRSYTYLAAVHNRIKVLMLLIDLKADVNISCESGWTPLMVAAIFGNVGVMERIIECGGRMDAMSKEGSNALSFAITQGKKKAAMLLIRSKADLKMGIGEHATTVFTLACEAGHHDIAKELLKHNADMTLGGKVAGSCPALQRALSDGASDTITFLINSKADINAIQFEKPNWAAIHWCTMHSTTDILKILIESSADVNRKTDRGMTPLMLAALHGKHKVAEVLVNSGADLISVSSDNLTALDYAAYGGQLQCIEVMGPFADVSQLRELACKLPIDIKKNLPEMHPCSNCGVRPVLGQKKLRKCGRCRTVRYCSRNCQVSDWANHKCQ